MTSDAVPFPKPDASEAQENKPALVALHTPVNVRSISLAVIAVFAVIYMLKWGQAFFIPVMFGIMMSYTFGPIVDRLDKYRIPRAIGATIVLVAIVGGFGSAVYALRHEVAAIIETLPEVAQKFEREIAKRGQKETPLDKVQKAASEIEKVASDAPAASPAAHRGVTLVQVEKPKFDIRDLLWTSTLGAIAFVGQVALVVFLAYFLMVSGDTFRRKLVKITGPTLAKKKVTVEVLNEITAQIQRFLLVQLFTSALVGVAAWLAFTALGSNNASTLGIVAGVCDIVPYLGAAIAVAGVAVVSFVQFGTINMMLLTSAILVLVFSLEGGLITPWLTGKASRMNPVVVFVGVLFWGWLWGPYGLLLGVPILMVIKSVCDHVEDLQPIGELLGD